MNYKRINYDVTDSTNTRAKEFAKNRDTADRSTVVFTANEQTAGRGRLGRSFHSASGAGIYISLLIYPEASVTDATAITAYAAVKLCRAIAAFTDADVRIKWVNDLLIGGKKLAGILTEGKVAPDGTLSYLVCGIGINLYRAERSEELSRIATSLEEGAGLLVDKEALTQKIIDEFLADTDYSAPDILEEYRRRSAVTGRPVTVVGASETYEATAVRILEDYSLLVRRPDGREERIFTGEISVRLK